MNDIVNTALIDLSRDIICISNKQSLNARLIGGCAIALKYGSFLNRNSLKRVVKDIDLVIPEENLDEFIKIIKEFGFKAVKEFNYIYGNTRRLYRWNKIIIDIFINRINMNRSIEIPDNRIANEEYTIPVTEMLLEKLQIRNKKESKLIDLTAILANEKVQYDNEGITLRIIIQHIEKDWPFYNIAQINIREYQVFLKDVLQKTLNESEIKRINGNLFDIWTSITEAPKSLLWHIRSSFGERVKWYKSIAPIENIVDTLQ